ncbi:hypothetical protein BC830DRAFT_1099223 [Chytriomyces sp. MP71]|nr:hypothetical protein BC830DRAFT_1099223 [Chytriomyces sp. MP71]
MASSSSSKDECQRGAAAGGVSLLLLLMAAGTVRLMQLLCPTKRAALWMGQPSQSTRRCCRYSRRTGRPWCVLVAVATSTFNNFIASAKLGTGVCARGMCQEVDVDRKNLCQRHEGVG